jgi:O-antigen ligase
MHASTTTERKTAPGDMIAGDYISRAAAADPFGDRFHTILLVLWAFTLPLGMIPWAKEVMLGALIVWGILRATVGRVDYAWWGVPRSPIAWLLVAWVALASLSLLWSPNPEFGADQLGALRFVGVPFAAWPVLRHWRKAMAGFLLGGTIVAAVIIAQGIGWIDPDIPTRPNRPAASMSVWSAGLICTATFLGHYLLIGVKPGAASIVWHVGGAAIAIMAIVLNATRSCWIALAIAAVGGVLVLFALAPTLRWRTFLIATAAVTGLAASTTIDEALLGSTGSNMVIRRTVQALHELNDSSHIAVNRGTVSYRLKAWNGGRNVIEARPILGWGLGGLSTGMLRHPGLSRSSDQNQTSIDQSQFNPHSSYIYQAATTGLIGLALLVGLLAVAVTRVVLRMGRDPHMIVPLALLSAWIVVSVFESTLLTGVGVGLLLFFLIPAMVPSAHVTVEPRR